MPFNSVSVPRRVVEAAKQGHPEVLEFINHLVSQTEPKM